VPWIVPPSIRPSIVAPRVSPYLSPPAVDRRHSRPPRGDRHHGYGVQTRRSPVDNERLLGVATRIASMSPDRPGCVHAVRGGVSGASKTSPPSSALPSIASSVWPGLGRMLREAIDRLRVRPAPALWPRTDHDRLGQMAPHRRKRYGCVHAGRSGADRFWCSAWVGDTSDYPSYILSRAQPWSIRVRGSGRSLSCRHGLADAKATAMAFAAGFHRPAPGWMAPHPQHLARRVRLGMG
jgi:hypothetical protein